jgi:hypothetical protein
MVVMIHILLTTTTQKQDHYLTVEGLELTVVIYNIAASSIRYPRPRMEEIIFSYYYCPFVAALIIIDDEGNKWS